MRHVPSRPIASYVRAQPSWTRRKTDVSWETRRAWGPCLKELAFTNTDEKDFTCQQRYAIQKTNNNAVRVQQTHELCEMKFMQNLQRMKRETTVKRRIVVFFQTIVSVDLRRNYLGQNLSGIPQFPGGFGYPRGILNMYIGTRGERNGCAAKSLFYYVPV